MKKITGTQVLGTQESLGIACLGDLQNLEVIPIFNSLLSTATY